MYQREMEGKNTSDLVVGKAEEVKDEVVGVVKEGAAKVKAAVK